MGVGKSNNSSEKLLYADFEKVILDFQLAEHQQFLMSFTSIFKHVDTGKHGVLNENQFILLLEMMFGECQSYLQEALPEGTKKPSNLELIQNRDEISYLVS